MKKAAALLAIIALTSFSAPQQAKEFTITLTAQETQIVFDALGELPAKVSEGIRVKIARQVQEQNKAK